jgi:hypothetical protein
VGSYTVIGTVSDLNYKGSATNTMVIGQADGSVALSNLNATYDGTAKAVIATPTPSGLTVNLTYNGLGYAPTNAGSYTVIGTISDVNYKGSATNTLVIDKAEGSVLLGNLTPTYDGTGKSASATPTPLGLTVDLTYNGSAIAPTNAGSYTVIGTISDINYQGASTNTMVIGKATGSVLLGNLTPTYDGTGKSASATPTPTGLTVNLTYNGSAIAPTNAGSYTVIGTISDVNYQGASTNTMVIGKAAGSVLLGNLTPTYDGTAKVASATPTPLGLTVDLTYNGSAIAPTNAGSYTVIGTIGDNNYQGSATNTMVIGKATGSIVLGNLNPTYDGTAKVASATPTPSSLAVDLTYNGNANAPTNVGSYTVIGTISDINYQGSATNTMVIGKGTATVILANLNAVYDGNPKAATASTVPAGLTVDLTYDGNPAAPTAIGSYTVVGTVNDFNYQGSATNTLVIARIVTTVTLDSLSNPSLYGAPAKFTATVSPSGATGTITFKDGATALGTVALSGDTSVLSTSTLSGGSHAITALYNGDTSHDTNISSVLTQVVKTRTNMDITYAFFGMTNGNMHLCFTNASGLASVQGVILVNCTLSGTAYDLSGHILLPNPIGAISTSSRTLLPPNCTKVILVANKINARLLSGVTAAAWDSYGRVKTIDPIMTTLVITEGNQAQQSISGIYGTERYLQVINNTPGLRSLEVSMNGCQFRLDPLRNEQAVATNLGAAMIDGTNNVVTLTGHGETGASALILLTDMPADNQIGLTMMTGLKITPTANGTVVSWPDALSNWQLQSSERLTSGWSDVPNTPAIQDGRLTVTVEKGDKPQFFRLRKTVAITPTKTSVEFEPGTSETLPTLRNPQGIVW